MEHITSFVAQNNINPVLLSLLLLLAVWSLVWKGFALWQAARNHQKVWFVILIIVNSLGILEILYLLAFCKNKNKVTQTTTVTHTTTASTPSPEVSSVVAPT